MTDLPYQPAARDRKSERERAAKLPGYIEARQDAADDALIEELSRGQAYTQKELDRLRRAADETDYILSIPGARESILEGMATPSEELFGKEALEW